VYCWMKFAGKGKQGFNGGPQRGQLLAQPAAHSTPNPLVTDKTLGFESVRAQWDLTNVASNWPSFFVRGSVMRFCKARRTSVKL
jgi:hypothetical protein